MKTKEGKNSRKIQENLKRLTQGLEQIRKAMKELDLPEDVLEKEIKPFGNASHIILPKEYANNKAKIIIKRK
jgi:putative transposon-encoded protein